MLNRLCVSAETHDVRAEAIDNAIAACVASDIQVVIPPELAMDVLMCPAFATARPLFRQWCLSNLKELPGITEIDRDRLVQMVSAGM